LNGSLVGLVYLFFLDLRIKYRCKESYIESRTGYPMVVGCTQSSFGKRTFAAAAPRLCMEQFSVWHKTTWLVLWSVLAVT